MFKDDNLQISIRLADGSFHPLFLCHGPQNCQLVLIPAHEDQEKIELHIYSHRLDSLNAQSILIGTLTLNNLQKSDNTGIKLNAGFDYNGILQIKIYQDNTENFDDLKANLSPQIEENAMKESGKRRKIISGILGVVIIVSILALLIWVAFKVADWGQQSADQLPVSIQIEKTHTQNLQCFS